MAYECEVRWCAAALMLPLWTASLPALARAPGEAAAAVPGDRVELVDGGMVRGTIVEILPKESVAIVSAADGRALRFDWQEVSRFVRDGAVTEVEFAVDPVRAPVYEPPPEVEGPRLHVELSWPAPVHLYEVTGEVFAHGPGAGDPVVHYRSRCVAPCDRVIAGDRARNYFFGGEGVSRSPRFTLSGSGELTARVHPGRRALKSGGQVAMALGGLGLVGGGVLLAVANLGREWERVDHRWQRTRGNYTPGAALLGMGAALVVSGVVMYLLGRTRVTWARRPA